MSAYTDNAPLIRSTLSYVKVGLGGTRNCITNQRTTSNPTSSPSLTTRTESTVTFYTGIGGAGNRTNSQDRAFLSIEEDHERNELRRASAATARHHGIGGAGNRSLSDDDSSRASSLSSLNSLRSNGEMERMGAADRIKEVIGEEWEKRNRRVRLFKVGRGSCL